MWYFYNYIQLIILFNVYIFSRDFMPKNNVPFKAPSKEELEHNDIATR